MTAVLLLFDVDGTLLVRGAQAHKEASHVALREVFGLDDVSRFPVATPGKTDLQIAREVLLKAGIDARTIDERLPALADAWCQAHARLQGEITDRVAPGMRELLEWLSGRDGVRLALLTGNLEPGSATSSRPGRARSARTARTARSCGRWRGAAPAGRPGRGRARARR